MLNLQLVADLVAVMLNISHPTYLNVMPGADSLMYLLLGALSELLIDRHKTLE